MAKHTKSGLIGIIDIQNMFSCFKLDRELWPFFTVEHPTMGLFCFKRMPQGWIVCPSIARNFMLQILYKFKHCLCRYLDDIVFFGETREEFLSNLKGILETLKHAGFRVKGCKMQLLGNSIKLLGKNISNGKIGPSLHVVESLDDMNHLNMVTKKSLKSFLGCCAYISDHLPYSAQVLHILRQAAIGTNAADVTWTEDLKAALVETKLKVKKLLTLHPVEPEKEIYVVCDSSYFANAGFLYQVNSEGSKNFIKIFSRRRSDADNKRQPSSCHVELTGITAVMVASRVELERCNKQVTIFTDSQSVASLYNKMKTTGVPSEDRKINECFSQLMMFNYKIIYLPADNPAINFADFISRTKQASEPCKGCLICEQVDSENEFFYTKLAKISQNIANEYRNFETEFTPTVSFEKFLELQYNVFPTIPSEQSYPYGHDSGWLNTLKPKDDLKSMKTIEHSLQYVSTRRSKNFLPGLKVQDILNDTDRIRQWQHEDRVIRKSIEILKQNVDVPNKLPRVSTLLVKEKCFLGPDDGILYRNCKEKLHTTIKQIVFPEKLCPQLVNAVHNSMGHGSMTKLENEVKRLFYVKNIKANVQTLVSRCKKCMILKNGPKVARKMKNFDEETSSVTRIGQRIFLDEVHRFLPNPMASGRTLRSNADTVTPGVKLVFASEMLSRYSTGILFANNMTADKLRQIILEIKEKLAPTETDEIEMIIRMDNMSAHVSLLDDPILKAANIKIDLRPKISGSKNNIALLDGRIAKFSKFLTAELSEENTTKSGAIARAIRRYNFTISAEGFRPTEIFHGRLVNTGEPILIPIEALINAQLDVRAAARRCIDQKNFDIFKSRPIKFIPYSEGLQYTNRSAMPIKVGDYITVDQGSFDKNNFRPIQQIVRGKGFENGINWDENIVLAKKVNSRSKPSIWRMDWIKSICDGNYDLDEEKFSKLILKEHILASREDYGSFRHILYKNLDY